MRRVAVTYLHDRERSAAVAAIARCDHDGDGYLTGAMPAADVAALRAGGVLVDDYGPDVRAPQPPPEPGPWPRWYTATLDPAALAVVAGRSDAVTPLGAGRYRVEVPDALALDVLRGLPGVDAVERC